MPGESWIGVQDAGSPTKKIHAWQRLIGSDNVEDEIVIPGEPYLAAYSIVIVGLNPFLQSRLVSICASASLNVRVHRIRLFQSGSSVPATNSRLPFSVVRLSTAHGGGSLYTPPPLDSRDAAAGMSVRYAPTSGTLGNVLVADELALKNALPLGPDSKWLWASRGHVKPLFVPAGTANGLLVIGDAAPVTGSIVSVAMEVTEANF